MSNNPAPGWYQDPTSPSDGRYWDGTTWTDSVSRAGQTITIPIDAERAALPPVPGSELQPPAPVSTPPPAQAVTVNSKSSPAGIIFGVLAAVLVVVLILVLANNNDSSETETPTTEAPAPTEAPPATEGG